MLSFSHFIFCPACGKKQLEVHEKNGMKCLLCGYIYFHNCASAVAAIIETGKGILLTKRNHSPKKGCLDLPGGFCDYGETLESALAREIHEELHLTLKDMRYFGSFPNTYIHKNVTYFTMDAVFTCKVKDLSALILNNELSDVCFVKPLDISFAKIAFVSTKKALKKYAERKMQ